MKQVQMHAYGAPEVLQLADVDRPDVQPETILIAVKAAGVNFSDILRRRNTYFMPTPLPYVLGAEAVGVVVETGPGVDAQVYPKGSLVLAILPQGGAYSEYVVAPAMFCVPLPPHLDAFAASGIFVQGCTAHLLLHQVAGSIEGKTILVHAGASGVGSLLLQMARLAGAGRLISTASTPEKRKAAQKFGADAVVDYTQTDWPDAVIAANGGQKVDLILEMVGGDVYAQSFSCLAQGGSMVVYGAASGQKGFIHSEHFVDESHHLQGFNLAHFIGTKMDLWQASLGAVIGMLAVGQIQVETSYQFALQDAMEAHRQIEARQTIGKVVLIP